MSLGEQFDTILPAARRGAAWALDALYRDLAPALAGYLRLQGSEEAEDLVSEVFLGAFRALEGFSGGEPQWRSLVFSIAYRRLVDERRRRSRRLPTSPLDDLDDLGGDRAGSWVTEDEVMTRLEADRLRRLCDRLSADQRDVILLRLVADLSVEDTAAALGKRPGAVKALQRRGLEALRRALAREISAEGVSG